MKLKRIAILLYVAGIYSASIAQNVVYKCEDSKGVLSYLNEPQDGFNCKKTELGSLKNMAAVKNEGTKGAISATNSKVQDFNQKIGQTSKNNEAEQKRLIILNKELDEEKKLFDTTNNIYKNIPDKKSDDAKRVNDILENHKRNIEALEGQIAKIKNITANAQTMNGLPINIPSNEMKNAIEEGKKIGSINNLPTNQLVVDRIAVPPTSIVSSIKGDLTKQIDNAKSAEEAVKLSTLALEEAKKQLEEIEKKAQEAKEQLEKEKYQKALKDAKDSLRIQEELNAKNKAMLLKAEDELLVIMKRQNLLLEERNLLWKKQQKLAEEKRLKELEEKKIAEEKHKKEILIKKNKELAENKMKLLIEQQKILEKKNAEILNKKSIIDKSVEDKDKKLKEIEKQIAK